MVHSQNLSSVYMFLCVSWILFSRKLGPQGLHISPKMVEDASWRTYFSVSQYFYATNPEKNKLKLNKEEQNPTFTQSKTRNKEKWVR